MTSWHTFGHHDIFFTSWQTCDVMTNFVTSWQTLWRYYVFLLHFMINFVTSWRLFTSCQTFRSNDELFEVMMKLLTSWRIFWHHDEFFDIMTCLWHYDEFVMWQAIDVMTCVALIDVIMIILTPGTFWQHFCRYDCIFFIISGSKYNWNVFLCYNEPFWLHDKLFDDMAKVLTLWTFNVMTHFLRLWRHKHKLTT